MSQPHKNNPKHFPGFRFEELINYAAGWVDQYPDIEIKRVNLYPLETDIQEVVRDSFDKKFEKIKKVDPRLYAIVFEIIGCENVKESDVDSVPNIEDDSCLKFMKDCRHAGKGDKSSHPFLNLAFRRKVYEQQPMYDNFRKEWLFFYKRPNDKLSPLIKVKEHWVLYDSEVSICEEEMQDLAADASPLHVFRQLGPTWEIVYNGKPLRGLKGKGFRYIYFLVKHPHKEYHTDQIAKEGEKTHTDSLSKPIEATTSENESDNIKKGKKTNDHRNMLYGKSKEELKKYWDDLKKELKEAEEYNDPDRKEIARKELEDFEEYYFELTRPGDKSRKFRDGSTKTRDRITKSIERALDTIKKYDEATGRHFYNALKPIHSYYLSYTPDRHINWLPK